MSKFAVYLSPTRGRENELQAPLLGREGVGKPTFGTESNTSQNHVVVPTFDRAVVGIKVKRALNHRCDKITIT